MLIGYKYSKNESIYYVFNKNKYFCRYLKGDESF